MGIFFEAIFGQAQRYYVFLPIVIKNRLSSLWRTFSQVGKGNDRRDSLGRTYQGARYFQEGYLLAGVKKRALGSREGRNSLKFSIERLFAQ